MREILFKAKSKKTGEWVIGYYVFAAETLGKDNMHVIFDGYGLNMEVEVDQTTLCQYTGLTDKNDKRIFEGDRLCLDKGEEYEKTGFVSYSSGVFIIRFEKTWDFLCTNIACAEVIGNIHDKEESK